MSLRRPRLILLAATISIVASACLAATASAAITESHITSPGDPSYTLYDRTQVSPPPAFTVTGTTVGTGNVDVACYYGSQHATIAESVTVTGNSFSVPVEAPQLPGEPCVLRAVPEGDTSAYPPGESDPFTGPRVARSEFNLEESSQSKVVDGYDLETYTLSGYYEFLSAGECGLDYSGLFAPGSLVESDNLFDCNGALYESDDPASGPSTRSEIQIDGQNAYDTSAASRVYQEAEPSNKPPAISVTKTFDTGTGLATVHEVEPLVKCSTNTYPPTESSCGELVSAGVQLERTWQTTNAGQVAYMTDTWHSTDGNSHTLNALYDQEFVDQASGGAYQFPGQSGFAGRKSGESVSLPGGANTILFKEDQSTPDSGDLEHPQGAIVYDSAPSEALSFYRGTEENYNGFEMPYQRTIPAGGSYTLRMAYIQAYSLSEVNSLAATALASYQPAVGITSPASGDTVATPSVTVSGTASDNVGLSSLTVGGKAVSVEPNGTWTTSVPLTVGANTITATATNEAGNTKSASITVTYTPVSSPPPPPVAHASQVGSVSGANGKVTFTLACSGVAGTRCNVKVSLITIEKLRGKRLIGVAAQKRHSKRVTVASLNISIPAGDRVRISLKLNAAGRRLLARFGKLPAHLSVVQSASAGTAAKTVVLQNLTVKPVKKRKKHH